MRIPSRLRASRRSPLGRWTAPLAVGALVALAAAPSTAFGQAGHSLALSGPDSAAVGRATVIQATGTVPPDVFLNRYLNVYAISTDVVQSCPSTFQSALQLKDNSTSQGSETVALAVPADGNFSIPVAYTPRVSGRFLLCGYVHDLVDTWAMASHSLQAVGGDTGGGATGATKPSNVSQPRLTRTGRTLRCSRGTWSGSPTGYSYHWTVNGRRKAGATRVTLRVTRALEGTRVRCGVTARNAAGTTTRMSRVLRVR